MRSKFSYRNNYELLGKILDTAFKQFLCEKNDGWHPIIFESSDCELIESNNGNFQ